MKLDGRCIACLSAAYLVLAGCGFGRVNQGQVVRFEKEKGLLTLVSDSNYMEPGKPRFDVLPAVIVRIPKDRREMGPEPEPGWLLRLDWPTSTAVIFDPAGQQLRRVPFTIVELHDNVGRGDPLLARTRFPVVDVARGTVSVYLARERRLAVLSVGADELRLPREAWTLGDEVRYYYKDPAQALRLMNVTRTDLSTAGK